MGEVRRIVPVETASAVEEFKVEGACGLAVDFAVDAGLHCHCFLRK